ncbi:NAD(P)/FAD-dependent oxidoreductase [Salicibibacter kimchii]|uniref:Ferredoxin--NADP reductase n=1 Tax=Salicibibacter kimchii TaxID=2099786 RepID=A0A345BXF9_9BACI|nr:NAD(P)/FAD-dependent oxidoreductase [Salicibibacter kimchii]AXF55640.1 NAD(P)/FAD-dependent oxidoreductase [Salicibibacter kimchii]
MLPQQETYDVTIIGGGPAGLFAAFYAGMRQLKVKVIESMPELGGQLSALYPEKYIYDVAGFSEVTGQGLVDQLKGQTMQFEPSIVLNETVQQIEKDDEGWFTLSTEENVHFSKTILITAGVGSFQPRRLALENAQRYENKNLHYFIDDLNQFEGKDVFVCGGGDSAVDWALMLEPIAKNVHLCHRRSKFRAHEHSVEKLERSSINVLTPYKIEEIIGDDQALNKIVIQEAKGDKQEEHEIDDLIVNYGFISSLGPIKNWGLEIEKNSIVVNSKMETNVEGIFGAGDITTYEGKVKLIATGFGEAPTAISNVTAYLDPNSRLQPQHSTNLFPKIGQA